MGVSQAIAFSLIALVVLSTLVSVAAIYEKSQDVYNTALAKFHQLEINSQDTSLHITGVANSGQKLVINLTNEGSTNLYDYTHFALIVDYYQNVSDSPYHSVSLYSYSSSDSPYQWKSSSGIISPDTSGELEVILPGAPYPGQPAVVVVATSVGPSSFWSGNL